MPNARIQNQPRPFNLHYERTGRGEPLLLIRGLGRSSRFWGRIFNDLGREFDVIAFDNRGIGRSQAPLSLYSTATLARDCVGLLDALNLPRVHVFGMSLGGMIAQELALLHRDRVGRLILGCTTPGGLHALRPPSDVAANMLRNATLPLEARNRRIAEHILSEDFIRQNPQILDQWLAWFQQEPLRKRDLLRQLAAAASHDTWERLPHLKPATLALTGDADKLIPCQNSRLLAERIPDARAHFIKGAGHDFTTERPEEALEIIVDFLLRA